MMSYTRALTARFRTNESGATSIEYAMIAAGIAVAIVATVQTLGTKVNSLFALVQGAFQ